MQTVPDFSIEAKLSARGYDCIAGIDEAGRGSWSGPVVAAAVVFHSELQTKITDIGLNDSKKITANRRDTLFDIICENADVGVGFASAQEIDEINILQATFLAMGRAMKNLTVSPDFVLVDGNKEPPIQSKVKAIVKGDATSSSIAAASIVAKVTRDKLMVELDSRCPGYGWEQNKGYGTKQHQEGLRRFGVTDHHRKSYKPIINILRLQDV